MPSIISAGTTANTGLNLTADTSGNLVFQTNGNTTAMTIDTSQNVTYANGVSFTGVIAGNGANISSMNASNLTSGTVANARTTAASANGASTIVLRDSNGSFAGNVGTFTSVSGNGSALTAISASNISSGTLASARLPAGTVLQVVQTVKTDTFQSGTTSSWLDITGLSLNITPTSTSSRILVEWSVCYGGNTGAIGYYLRLVRGSTAIAIGDAASNRQRVTQAITPSNVDSYGGATSAIGFVDSPATTSSTTYKIQLYQIPGTQGLPINRSWDDSDITNIGRWISSITATEIAA